MLGSLLGKEMHLLYPEYMADAGAYALVGMGALVAGATHAPITAILIIFELTNDYHIIPPLMVSCIIAVLLASYLKKESIYTMKLIRRGINIFEGKDINILRALSVKDVLNTEVETIQAHDNFNEIIKNLLRSRHQEYFIVDEGTRLLGMTSLHDIKEFLKDEEYLSGLVIAADIAQAPGAYLHENDNLDLVMHQFGRNNMDELPVIEDDSTLKLIGSVRRKDVIDAYNREIFKYDLAGGVHSVVTAVTKEREVELTEGYRLAEIDPPDGFIGKSIRDLNIRARYGVEIILIRKPVEDPHSIPGRPGAIPTPDYVINPGDKFLILGDTSGINRLRHGSK
jgi:CIC family chloride channel protein